MSRFDQQHLALALALARRGEGRVEPNPMVGCAIARDDQVLGAGWHQQFGRPHAEVNALRAAGKAAAGADLFVTLEPCGHQGKTPACCDAIIAAGISRVVIGMRDPFPKVDGAGIATLQAAGIRVEMAPQQYQQQVASLCAPYRMLIHHHRPWVIAKWAMTLDGKIATATGDSRWISGEASRRRVHQLRGQVDAILVGRATAQCDDPLLTARPPGPRLATRIVADRLATLSPESQLVRTIDQAPVLVAVSADADPARCQRLRDSGCEIFTCTGATHALRLSELLTELGCRRMTNLLVEGGSRLLGELFDLGRIDEVRVFVAPKLSGGAAAPGPLGGRGLERMAEALDLCEVETEMLDRDIYLRGRVAR